MPSLAIPVPQTRPPPERRAPSAVLRHRRTLVAALVLSLLVHVAVSLLPEDVPEPAQSPPLTATLTTLPPPPQPVAVAPPTAAPSPAAPKRRTRPAPPALTAPAAVTAQDAPEVASPPDTGKDAAGEDSAQTAGAAPAALAEDVGAPGGAAVQAKTLPPRVDLAYKVFFGTHGFQIGEATYRFEHAQSRYRISTVGQARGLAALLVRGQGRVESRGVITTEGLQPLQFSVDRFNRRGRESADFDWEAGVVTLADDKSAALDLPTFDPLTLMWQYYFTPPDGDRLTFSIATTRRVARYTVTREGRETIAWQNGTIETERWVRVSEDGKTEAYAWLAPGLRYIPVKMRVTNTTRGTVEAVLDAIRVDETGETVGRDDLPFAPSPPETAAAAATVPGYSPPGATFPSMTP